MFFMYLLFMESDDIVEHINLDELYERKREIKEQKETVYKKILTRIIKKIKITSRLKHEEQYCFYVVPEVIIGFPRYDVNACIEYIVGKLEENKLFVKYTHPNMLFISWQHYIPSYERNEIKKKTNVQMDNFINTTNKDEIANKLNIIDDIDEITRRNTLFNTKYNDVSSTSSTILDKTKTEYKKISSYKPLGIYNEEMLRRISDKI